MKRSYGTMITAIGCALLIQSAHADVSVDDLVASRREGTDLIDIGFKLRTHDAITYPDASVTLTVSSGGAPLTATALTGDVGSGVAMGPGKAIVWDAGADGGLPEGLLSITVRATIQAPWHGDPHARAWEVVHTDWVRNTYTPTSGSDPDHYTLSNRDLGMWADHLYLFHSPDTLYNGDEAHDAFSNLNRSGYANRTDWSLPTRQRLLDMEPYAHLFVGTSQAEMRNLVIWTDEITYGTYTYMIQYADHQYANDWFFEEVDSEDEYFEDYRAAIWPVHPAGDIWDTPRPSRYHEDTVAITIEAAATTFPYTPAPGGGVIVTGYTGEGGSVILDATLGGEPVVEIGEDAFAEVDELDSLMIPPSVAHLGHGAFAGSGIGRLLFRGDAPTLGDGVFEGSALVIYRRYGTSGWGDTLGGRPVELWRAALGTGGGVGMGQGGFQFHFNGPPEDLAVLEVRDGFDGVWTEVQSQNLDFGDHAFVDPQPSPSGMRFYRVVLKYPD